MLNDLLSAANPFGRVMIYEDHNLIEPTNEPRKKHQWTGRKSSTGQYHWRVQKKWNKRHGFVMRPMAYKIPRGIICHPTIAPAVAQ